MNPNDKERRQAFRKAKRARSLLDEAARDLGAEDVHELAREAEDAEFSARINDGVRAITNAHSYLDNGDLEGLVKDL